MNGSAVDIEAFNINGRNYVQLLDLAILTNRFAVDYDEQTRSVLIDTAKSYIDPNTGRATVLVGEQLSATNVHAAMIALQSSYPHGMRWTNDNFYAWNGGIYSGGYGCAAFAFILSDAAFGTLPARMHYDFNAIKVGDIVRINNDTHFVVVMEIGATHFTLAEGNFNSSVHWGRTMTINAFRSAFTYVLTRHPE
jgi:hypothetical protein